ncbi:hypothetical protein EUBSIR_01518 [[Eubacterium] siraeum DSM 15702]|uniref:Uncharacterized protein n=1 Tax=[Eubacterium] siraeum DSM 15702 TaxID=428128 RepID=B0MNW0_9FIRM|nr:hypothetical protein EUBSIR_01518 [[Eubacterium] siraeum DSM 15702]
MYRSFVLPFCAEDIVPPSVYTYNIILKNVSPVNRFRQNR